MTPAFLCRQQTPTRLIMSELGVGLSHRSHLKNEADAGLADDTALLLRRPGESRHGFMAR